MSDIQDRARQSAIAALASEGMLCPPGTLAELERLRSDRQILSDRCLRMGVELDELRAGLDAAPTEETEEA